MSGKRARHERRRNPVVIPPDAPIVWFGPGGSVVTHQEHVAAQERACADDQAWFDAHPQATGRLRLYVPGELPHRGEGCRAFVFVRQVRPGVRMRQVVEPIEPAASRGALPGAGEPEDRATSPDQPTGTLFGLDLETGEVLGKYSEAQSWEDALFHQWQAGNPPPPAAIELDP